MPNTTYIEDINEAEIQAYEINEKFNKKKEDIKGKIDGILTSNKISRDYEQNLFDFKKYFKYNKNLNNLEKEKIKIIIERVINSYIKETYNDFINKGKDNFNVIFSSLLYDIGDFIKSSGKEYNSINNECKKLIVNILQKYKNEGNDKFLNWVDPLLKELKIEIPIETGLEANEIKEKILDLYKEGKLNSEIYTIFDKNTVDIDKEIINLYKKLLEDKKLDEAVIIENEFKDFVDFDYLLSNNIKIVYLVSAFMEKGYKLLKNNGDKSFIIETTKFVNKLKKIIEFNPDSLWVNKDILKKILVYLLNENINNDLVNDIKNIFEFNNIDKVDQIEQLIKDGLHIDDVDHFVGKLIHNEITIDDLIENFTKIFEKCLELGLIDKERFDNINFSSAKNRVIGNWYDRLLDSPNKASKPLFIWSDIRKEIIQYIYGDDMKYKDKYANIY